MFSGCTSKERLDGAVVDADGGTAYGAADVGCADRWSSASAGTLTSLVFTQRTQILLDLGARGCGQRQLEGGLQRGELLVEGVRGVAHGRVHSNCVSSCRRNGYFYDSRARKGSGGGQTQPKR